MAQAPKPKQPYQPPSITSLRVFLPMLAATTGGGTHRNSKQRLPFQTPH
jgi:hypothetical protein